MMAHSIRIAAALGLTILLFAMPEASALTLEERWRAEDLKWRRISASICEACGTSRKSWAYAVLIDPVAILERKTPAPARTLAIRHPQVVAALTTDRTLVPRYRKRIVSDALRLKRRQQARLLQARRQAALISRRRAQAAAAARAAVQAAALQAAARAATASDTVELGALRWDPE